MSEREREDPLAARARAQLDRDADALDEATRLRLRAARLRSLDALDARPSFAIRRRVAVASAGVGALALAFAAARWARAPAADLAFGDALDDVEILAGADDLELYDDLDFYRWLEDTQPI